MSKQGKNFEDNVKKKVLKNALALGASFLPEQKLIEAEGDAIKGIEKYFSENEGDYFFISPVIENDSLNAVLGIMKENEDGTITLLKQLPIKIEGNTFDSIPIRDLINNLLRSKIDLFNLFTPIKER